MARHIQVFAALAVSLLIAAPALAQAGKTVIVPRTRIQVDEGRRGKMIVLPANASLRELVDRLNAAGVSPRELITILQAIKAAGALQAEIIVR